MIGSNNVKIKEKLVRFNQEAEERDAERRASRVKKPYLRLITAPIEVNALGLIKEEQAKELKVAVINQINKDLIMAVFDLTEEVEVEVARLEKIGFKVDVNIVSMSGLEHAWSFYRHVKKIQGEITGQVAVSSAKVEEFEKILKTVADLQGQVTKVNFSKISVTEFLEILLAGALALKASDIHLEPTQVGGGVRFRLDGVMHEVVGKKEGVLIPNIFHKQIIARIKLLAGLKLNITDETQDGRFTIEVSEDDIEIRTAIAPAEHGEVAVLRILDPRAIKVGLEELGLRIDDLAIIKEHLKKPNGMLLNTGPTGSGKTTTLYAFLREVSKPENKVITVEDPIEYHLDGIEQTQVNEEAEYTFASGLKSILRQDPDVILVGEVRDGDTAGMAINASLTGHLVFSTLHTNDAAGAIPRLLDLGVKANIVGSALNLVIAQRLVRKVCRDCVQAQPMDEKMKTEMGQMLDKMPARAGIEKFKKVNQIFEPGVASEQCAKCGGTGYKGRVGIFELLEMNDEVRKLVEAGASILDIRNLARKQGMVTMQEDGILKVLTGLTSWAEIERATGIIENKQQITNDKKQIN